MERQLLRSRGARIGAGTAALAGTLALAGCLPAWPDGELPAGGDIPQVACDVPGMVFVAALVQSDDNGDKQVNKGENIGLHLVVKNCDGTPRKGVTGTIVSVDPEVTVNEYSDRTDFGDVGSGATPTGSSTVYFRVSESAQPHEVAFTLQLADQDGHAWDAPFTVPIVATGAGISLVTAQVTVDDNGDRVINKGENIGIKLTVRNGGTSKALSVRATLSSTDADVTVNEYSRTTEFGDIAAGAQEIGSSTLYFRVSESAAPHDVPFQLDIEDTAGNQWQAQFTLPIAGIGATIQFVTFQVSADDNGDRAVNRGENVGIKVTVKNAGTSKALSVSGQLSSTDADVTVNEYSDSTDFGDVAAGGQAVGSSTLYFRVSETAQPHEVPFQLALSDRAGNAWQQAFKVPLVATGARITFEAVQVTADDNKNAQANPGENVGIKVTVRNAGTSKALGVSGALSSTDAAVTVNEYSDTTDFGDIAAGASVLGTSTLYFRVSASATAHDVPFRLAVDDRNGNAWDLDFKVPIR